MEKEFEYIQFNVYTLDRSFQEGVPNYNIYYLEVQKRDLKTSKNPSKWVEINKSGFVNESELHKTITNMLEDSLEEIDIISEESKVKIHPDRKFRIRYEKEYPHVSFYRALDKDEQLRIAKYLHKRRTSSSSSKK